MVWKLTFPDSQCRARGNAFGGAAAEAIVTDTETMGWFGLWRNVAVPRKQKSGAENIRRSSINCLC